MDRNLRAFTSTVTIPASPPARVAWIETEKRPLKGSSLVVATREGGVDRNKSHSGKSGSRLESPPARVAWIETEKLLQVWPGAPVATREGGVDRNPARPGRRPGGPTSPPARVAWIET